MKKKILHLLLAFLLVLSVFPFVATRSESASLLSISDTMSRLKASENSNHEISFVTPTGVAAGQKIKVTFSANFTSGLNGVDFLDMDLEDDTVDLTLAAAPSGAAWGATVSTLTIIFVSGTGTIAGGSTVKVKIGNNATEPTTGDTYIANPSGPGSNTISIATTTAGDVNIDTGALAVPIMTNDQVAVSATVDPSITSALSGAGYPNCVLTLSASTVQGCEVINTVSTNAVGGYNSTIVENGNLCSPSVAVCTNYIDDVTDGVVSTVDTTAEYGLSTDDADAPGITADYDGTCGGGATETGSAITGTAQIYANEITPQSSDVTKVCHSAVIIGSTPAGIYSDIVTHITTGNF